MDEKLELTRRKALTGLGGIGAGAALGGTGTMAFLNDTETTEGNTVTAGELNLTIDWEEHYNDELVEDDTELVDNPGPIFELDDLKPGDHGEATISLHVFDNPAWVHMGGELTKNAEAGVNEPESKASGEDDTLEEQGGKWSGELADEILVDVWYDGTEEEADGGNNELELNEELIVSGTLTEVLDYLESGVLLEDQTGPEPTVSQASSETIQSSDVTAEFCGRVSPGAQTQQCIDCLDCEDSEPLLAVTDLSGFEYEPDEIPGTATHVTLKAANGCYVAEVDPDTTTVISMPDQQPDDADNNEYGEISNATFYRCTEDDNGNGDNDHDGCWPNSTTQYIGFSWELPFEVGNEIQSDEVAFDLKFYAQQCRHNGEPENPYDD